MEKIFARLPENMQFKPDADEDDENVFDLESKNALQNPPPSKFTTKELAFPAPLVRISEEEYRKKQDKMKEEEEKRRRKWEKIQQMTGEKKAEAEEKFLKEEQKRQEKEAEEKRKKDAKAQQELEKQQEAAKIKAQVSFFTIF
jgi:hypothetical protein